MLLQPLCRWTRPDNHAPVPNAALDLTRSKSELMLENALLRQQVIVLQRQTKRPKLTWHDRALLVLLASKLHARKQALIIVQPDTLLRWHRDLFRRMRRRKSKPRQKRGRTPLTEEHVALIKRMAKENLFSSATTTPSMALVEVSTAVLDQIEGCARQIDRQWQLRIERAQYETDLARRRGDGRYSTQAAVELPNVDRSTIIHWCKSGRLDGIQAVPRSYWWINLTPEDIGRLRRPEESNQRTPSVPLTA